MRLSRHTVAALAIPMLASTAGMAQDWKTLAIPERPGMSIEIPVGVDAEKVDPSTGSLMAFFGATTNDDEFYCFLNEFDYSSGQTQASFAKALGSETRTTFCEKDGAAYSEGTLLESKSETSSGYAAGYCVSSYTKSDEKMPGRVYASHIVAGKKAYGLQCEVGSVDQESAEVGWDVTLVDTFEHMRQSLRLP